MTLYVTVPHKVPVSGRSLEAADDSLALGVVPQ